MTTVEAPVDLEAQLGAIADQVFGASIGFIDLLVAGIGRETGLYRHLRDLGPTTTGALAAAAGLDERYVREWIEHQTIAGMVTVDDPTVAPADRIFTLPEAHALAMLDEECPAYVGALADIPAVVARTFGTVLEVFRTGEGIAFADYGLHDLQAGFTRAGFANDLASTWIAALPDVHERLVAGEPLRVLDVGCGEGWAGIYLARAYPAISVDGVDLDDRSVDAARRHAGEVGVADRVHFEVADIGTLDDGAYDLVMASEVIHDLADPVAALATMRRLAGSTGAVLIVDERADDEFGPTDDPVQRMLYGFSIFHCLPVGRHDHDHSAATGTVMRPATFEAYAKAAGFGRVEILPVENDFFRLYRPAD